MLRAMSAEERAAQSVEICNWLFGRLPAGATVLTFANLPTEPDLTPLWDRDLRLVFPRVCGDGALDLWLTGDPAADLSPGAYGIGEPSPECCAEVTLASIDVILTPGIAFKKENGVRLGQGGGFYDRLFSEARASTIGICFRQQLLDDVPTEAHDARVDQIAVWMD